MLLSTLDVASQLNVSPRTVCLWAECGELPGMKVGRQWRFLQEDINAWLADRRTSAADPGFPQSGLGKVASKPGLL